MRPNHAPRLRCSIHGITAAYPVLNFRRPPIADECHSVVDELSKTPRLPAAGFSAVQNGRQRGCSGWQDRANNERASFFVLPTVPVPAGNGRGFHEIRSVGSKYSYL